MDEQYNVENAIIGCLLLGDKTGEIFGEVAGHDFVNTENQELFKRLKVLWDLYGKLDIMSITDFPENQKRLAICCSQTVPALSQWKRYALQLREQTAKFNATSIALEIGMGNYGLAEIQEKAKKLVQAANGTAACESLSMTKGILNFMEEKNSPREYIKTGYPLLDKYTYIDKGDYVVIGGRPSAGKTSFSITLLLEMAKAGKKSIFFSLETSPKKIMDRIITSYCGLNFGNVKRQEMSGEWQKVINNNKKLAKLPIEIISASGKSVAWMQAQAIR